jgi:hypothetical protein
MAPSGVFTPSPTNEPRQKEEKRYRATSCLVHGSKSDKINGSEWKKTNGVRENKNYHTLFSVVRA